jgi:Flp pilus assembly protein TadB
MMTSWGDRWSRHITTRAARSISTHDGGGDMPLSEDEQRILRQIEEQLQSDTKFANAVSSSGLYKHSARTLRWGVVGLVALLAVLVIALQIHFLVAFVAFLGMLGCLVVIERNARAMGRAGIQDVAATLRNARQNARQRPTRD